MKVKHVILFTIWATAAIPAMLHAQTPMQILDKASDRIKKLGDMKAEFVATTFENQSGKETTSGAMWIKGKKMVIETPEMKTWYDGKKQWSMLTGNDEVNVTIPTEKETAAIHPYSFLKVYKKGYRLSQKTSTLRGEATYEVHMTARYTGYIAQEIYVDIAKDTYMPLCIRIRQDSQWTRISIHRLEGNLKLNDLFFTFPKEEFPDVEIINLY